MKDSDVYVCLTQPLCVSLFSSCATVRGYQSGRHCRRSVTLQSPTATPKPHFSYSEPKILSSVVRTSSNFKDFSYNHWVDCNQISYSATRAFRNKKGVQMVWVTCPIDCIPDLIHVNTTHSTLNLYNFGRILL